MGLVCEKNDTPIIHASVDIKSGLGFRNLTFCLWILPLKSHHLASIMTLHFGQEGFTAQWSSEHPESCLKHEQAVAKMSNQQRTSCGVKKMGQVTNIDERNMIWMTKQNMLH